MKLHGEPSVAGSIWFSKTVPFDALLGTLHALEQKADKERLIDLHLRASGDDGSHVIAFHYVMRKGTKREQRSITETILATVKATLSLRKRDLRYTMSTVLATV